jgi:DNA-binding response OmpR family regulator
MANDSLSVSGADERKPTILVVEDDLVARFALTDYLQDCGFNVFEASSADVAREMLLLDCPAFDLLVTDIQMPGSIDGFGLVRWILAHRPLIHIMVISGDEKSKETAANFSVSVPFFQMPYNFAAVAAQARSMLVSGPTRST